MGNLWQSAFASFLHWNFVDVKVDEDSSRQLKQAIEQLVDDSDPRLRVVRRYDERLRPAMQQALEYIDQLVNKIPKPVEVCARSFTEDPRIKAFFTNVDELHQIYSNSQSVRAFFDAVENLDAPECHALLCMHKNERRGFGVGLVGDQVRRDVAQVRVSFADHQILTPAPTESSARLTLRNCLLHSLLDKARDALAKKRQEQASALERRRQIHSHLRALEQERPDSGDAAAVREFERELGDKQRQLHQLDADLADLHRCLGDLDGHLQLLTAGLEQAPAFIRVEKCDLRINQTHLVLDPESDENGFDIPLAEVHLGDEPPRVVSLTRYPRDEFRPSPPAWQH